MPQRRRSIMNRIGDLGLLLAIFWLVIKTGHVDHKELFTQATFKQTFPQPTSRALLPYCFLLGQPERVPRSFIHWLPDAMAQVQPGECTFHPCSHDGHCRHLHDRTVKCDVQWRHLPEYHCHRGLATALLAASIAIRQNDIKKGAGYSTVSQLGFMFLALHRHYVAAVFHVLTHVFSKR